jgi:HPr kinase/phosphorylase
MTDQETLHGTVVAWGERGLLITGTSGIGKSGLGLDLMALGCDLVTDDGAVVTVRDGTVWVDAPPAIRGLIEARGIGLLNADATGPVRLVAVLDLDVEEAERLPPMRQRMILGCPVTLLHKPRGGPFPAALVQYLKRGRREP